MILWRFRPPGADMTSPPAALASLFVALALTLAALTPPAAAQAPRSFLGVGLKDLPGTAGAQVGVIAAGSPAAQAGVQVGDIIVAVGGRSAANTAAVVSALAALAPGQRAELSVLRAGRPLQLHALMGAAPAAQPAAEAAPPGPPAPAVSAAPLKVSGYTTFSDPEEHAFTVQVPSGWHTVGALTRRGALEISPFVRALSPDRMTYLMVGEPTLLSYTPPNATTRRLGWREGSLHDAGLGGVTMLLHYIAGAQFAQLYGQTALSGLCPQLRFQAAQQRNDFVVAADQLIPTVIPSTSTGGEATFSCRHGGQPMQVRVDAVTRTTRDNVLWNVIFLRALIAPSAQVDAAFEVLKHMTVTFKYDPAWVQQQNRMSQEAAAAINQRAQASLRAQQGIIASLNATDENFSAMDDIVSGYSNYRDERTGNVYKLSNTDPGKWVDDSSGRIVSTPDDNPPPWAAGYSRLTRVP
jgi:hypothetical protein